jgi:hypothetical protein
VPSKLFGELTKLLCECVAAKKNTVEAADALLALVVGYPWGVEDATLRTLLAFFAEYFDAAGRSESQDRATVVTASLLGALNHIVLARGVNLFEAMPECCEAVLAFAAARWPAKGSNLREPVLTFCRAQVRLHRSFAGKFLRLPSLHDLADAVRAELSSSAQERWLVSAATSQKVSRPQTLESDLYAMLDFAADILALQARDVTGEPTMLTSPAAPAKRRRRICGDDVWEDLVLQVSQDSAKIATAAAVISPTSAAYRGASSSPLPWIRLAAVVVSKHGSTISGKFLHSLLDAMLGVLHSTTLDPKRPEMLHMISWSLQTIANISALRPRIVSPKWEDAWVLIIRQLNSLGFSPDVSSVAFEALTEMAGAGVVSQRLVQSSRADIWKLPTFTSAPTSTVVGSALLFVSAFALLCDSAGESPDTDAVRGELLSWALSACALESHPADRMLCPTLSRCIASAVTCLASVPGTFRRDCEKLSESVRRERSRLEEGGLMEIEESLDLFRRKPDSAVPMISATVSPSIWKPQFLELVGKRCKGISNELLHAASTALEPKSKTLGVEMSKLQASGARIVRFACFISMLI